MDIKRVQQLAGLESLFESNGKPGVEIKANGKTIVSIDVDSRFKAALIELLIDRMEEIGDDDGYIENEVKKEIGEIKDHKSFTMTFSE